MMKQGSISKITAIHYVKLVFRTMLLLSVSILCLAGKFDVYDPPAVFKLIRLVFLAETLLRLVPSKYESMGCQKQFAKNYIPSGHAAAKRHDTARTFVTACAWIALNAAWGALYITGLINEQVLIVISLFYAVSDMICVLYFCLFQKWLMKNRCCVTCRIYNWDYIMMYTPLIFIKSFWTYSLVIAAIIVLVRWEAALYKHAEWFSPAANDALSCKYCEEKRCERVK